MRNKIVAGNWKMHFTLSEAVQWATDFKKIHKPHPRVNVIVAPPYVFLHDLEEMLRSMQIHIAAQNMHWEDEGAFTGEISAPMLVSMGVHKVILGHSERRMYFGETGEILRKKVNKALEHQMQVIFCVGEKLPEREAGKHFDTVRLQVEKSLFQLPSHAWKNIMIAYEPVWAIGTGKTASPEQAQEMHAFIRQLLKEKYTEEVADQVHILYGGSVKPVNAREIFSQPDVDGGLIGGASLKPELFNEIVEIAKGLTD